MGPFKDLNELKDLIPVLVFLLPGFVSAGIVALLRYSDDATERAIFLTQATWLTESGDALNDPPISILLDKDSEIAFVEFVANPQPTDGMTDIPQARQEIATRASETKCVTAPIMIGLFLVATIAYVLCRQKRDD